MMIHCIKQLPTRMVGADWPPLAREQSGGRVEIMISDAVASNTLIGIVVADPRTW